MPMLISMQTKPGTHTSSSSEADLLNLEPNGMPCWLVMVHSQSFDSPPCDDASAARKFNRLIMPALGDSATPTRCRGCVPNDTIQRETVAPRVLDGRDRRLREEGNEDRVN